jgi:hypothetical protein
LKKSLKKSSNGAPGGTCGNGTDRLSTVCEAEMFTTASMTCSTSGAKDSGAPRAKAGAVKGMTGVARTAVPSISAVAALRRREDVEGSLESSMEGILPLWKVGLRRPQRPIVSRRLADVSPER